MFRRNVGNFLNTGGATKQRWEKERMFLITDATPAFYINISFHLYYVLHVTYYTLYATFYIVCNTYCKLNTGVTIWNRNVFLYIYYAYHIC